MGSTRFYDRTSDECGPVIGSYQVIPFASVEAITNGADQAWDFVMPTGAKFKVADVVINTGTVVGTVVVDVGTTAAGTQITRSTLAATSVGFTQQATLKSYTPAATGTISVRVTAGAGETAALPFTVTLGGYISAEPTSTAKR